MITFKEFLAERIGSASIQAKKLGLKYYGSGNWGKDNVITHVQQGFDKLIPSKDKQKIQSNSGISSSARIRAAINKSKLWKKLDSGSQSAIYLGKDDKDVVYKISGAGLEWDANDQQTDLAFIHFLTDFGHKNKHLPIIIDINVDDPYVVQVKMERLKPIPSKDLLDLLSDLSDDIDVGLLSTRRYNIYKAGIDEAIKELSPANRTKILENNKFEDIIDVIKLLKSNMKKYGKMYDSKNIHLDLHSGNWLMRDDGTIVAADPWFGG